MALRRWLEAGAYLIVAACWAFYALGRLADPRAWSGALEPVGALAAVAAFLAAPLLSFAALIAILAWARRRGAPRLVVALVALALAALALKPLPQEAGGEPTFTILSWNVARLGTTVQWSGEAAAREEKAGTAECVVPFLREQAPDVVVLTEVSRFDFQEILLPALGVAERRCVHTAHDAAKPDSGGSLVCALGRTWSIASSRPVIAELDGLPDFQMAGVTFRSNEGALRLVALHLPPLHDAPEGWPHGSRIGLAAASQAAMVDAALSAAAGGAPAVLAGDFNQGPDAWIHARIRRSFLDSAGASRAFPAGTRLVPLLPDPRIDYIYAERERLSVASAGALDARCSDHVPVLARLTIR